MIYRKKCLSRIIQYWGECVYENFFDLWVQKELPCVISTKMNSVSSTSFASHVCLSFPGIYYKPQVAQMICILCKTSFMGGRSYF